MAPAAGADPTLDDGADACAQRICRESVAAIEQNLERVDELLHDSDARQMLRSSAHVWMPALQQVEGARAMGDGQR